jgi:hypothetical protein
VVHSEGGTATVAVLYRYSRMFSLDISDKHFDFRLYGSESMSEYLRLTVVWPIGSKDLVWKTTHYNVEKYGQNYS